MLGAVGESLSNVQSRKACPCPPVDYGFRIFCF